MRGTVIRTPVVDARWSFGQAKLLRIDDGTEAMEVNGTSAGSPTVLWNGTGGSDTGGDWTHESQGTESTESKHSGTNGLDSGVRTAGQETRFDNGSDIAVDGVYDVVTFWLNTQAYPVGSDLKIRWKKSGGGAPGSKLNISDYITSFDIGVWQQVTIPISDFNLGANQVAKLVLIYATKGGQHFWFDDFAFNTSAGGGPFTFQIAPANTSEQWHVGGIHIVLAATDGGWNSDAFANILGGLANGVLIRHNDLDASEDPITWSVNLRNNIDLFGRLRVWNEATFLDNEQLVTLVLKPSPATVVLTDRHVLEIVIRDNLSALTRMRAFLQYGKEDLT